MSIFFVPTSPGHSARRLAVAHHQHVRPCFSATRACVHRQRKLLPTSRRDPIHRVASAVRSLSSHVTTPRPAPHLSRKQSPAQPAPVSSRKSHTQLTLQHSHSTLAIAQSSRRRPDRSGVHGGEQQHHGVRQLPGPGLRGPRGGDGDLVRLQARGGVRAHRALARRHPRLAPPPRRSGRLRGGLLEPPGPPRRLPLRHGGAHHAPPAPPRLRLRRHPRLRRVPGARPRLPRVPPRRVLLLAARVRRRGRPAPVGGDQGLPRRVGHLQEAGERLHHPRAVLPVPALAAPVGVLQAADGVRVRVREPDGVDEPREPRRRRGLRRLEQRPWAALLRVRLLQGRDAGHPAGAVAQGQRRARRRHRRAHRLLRHRLQRLQERADRGPLPPLQVGQRLILIDPLRPDPPNGCQLFYGAL